MNTVFIGGSRHVSRLPADVRKRLDNVVASGHQVIVGDATGADKAVQKHLLDAHYDKVTVFCSGRTPRNNLGTWRTHQVDVPKSTKGFQFYAAKDRQMAREADFGLMIWDGKSPGTILNVLRLLQAGKVSVLFSVPDKGVVNIKSADEWRSFQQTFSVDLRADLKERATPEEWALVDDNPQQSLFPAIELKMPTEPHSETQEKAVSGHAPADPILYLNEALASGDTARIVETLGAIARGRGISQVARETGLARESLYRSLDAAGNPEFSTVMKVLTSMGLSLEVRARPAAKVADGRVEPSHSGKPVPSGMGT